MMGKSSWGMGGGQGSNGGKGETCIGTVKDVRRSMAGGERKIEVVFKDRTGLGGGQERAAIYMPKQCAEKIEKGKAYEFTLETHSSDRFRGGSQRRADSGEKNYRCEGIPVEVTGDGGRSGGGRFGGGSSRFRS